MRRKNLVQIKVDLFQESLSGHFATFEQYVVHGK